MANGTDGQVRHGRADMVVEDAPRSRTMLPLPHVG